MDECPQFGSAGRCFDCLEKPSCPPATQADPLQSRVLTGDMAFPSRQATDPRYGKVHTDGSRSGGQPPTATGDEGLVQELRPTLLQFAPMIYWLPEEQAAEVRLAWANDAIRAILSIIRAREAAAHAAGRAAERAAIVHYFRGLTKADFHELYCAIADAIERGQHKESKP